MFKKNIYKYCIPIKMRGIKIDDKFTVLDICVHKGLHKVHHRVVGHAFPTF